MLLDREKYCFKGFFDSLRFTKCWSRVSAQIKIEVGIFPTSYFLIFSSLGTITRVSIAEIISSAIEFVEITVANSFWIFPSKTFPKRKKIPPSTNTVLVSEPRAPAKISPALFLRSL